MRRMAMISLLFCMVPLLSIGCSPRLQETEVSRDMMDTVVTLTVLHSDQTRAEEAMEAAFAELGRIEKLMSIYIDDSEISVLNREGRVKASPETVHVIGRALDYAEISDGAFDVTVKPLLDLYRESFKGEGGPPTPEEVEAVRGMVGADRLKLEGDEIAVAGRTQITLDGIAKGYAIDSAVEILREHGVRHALVNVGGDVRALGDKNGLPWKVAMQNPRDADDLLAVVPLEDNAVATSGDYERYFEPTLKYHHIIDPRTGYSAEELISVTVVADTALDADSLATTVFVLGREEGMELVESMDDVEAMLITADLQIVFTGMKFTALPER